MKFIIPITNKILFSTAIAHGFIDITKKPSILSLYSITLIPSQIISQNLILDNSITTAFVISSFIHFKNDIGFNLSFLLHYLVFILYLYNIKLSINIILYYICFIHIPSIIIKFLYYQKIKEIIILLFFLFCSNTPPVINFVSNNFLIENNFIFDSKLQLFIIIHTIINSIISEE